MAERQVQPKDTPAKRSKVTEKKEAATRETKARARSTRETKHGNWG